MDSKLAILARTLAKVNGSGPQVLLPLAGLHLHGAQGRVGPEIAAANQTHVLYRDRGAVEFATAPGVAVRPDLAGGLEVALDVLAVLATQGAGHVYRCCG